ncbi:olfactory receptor-like protein COR4 isoform X2 [Rhineura floridana]|nr:olfactory receptor-like protein COR4 isoform X2 [Rhineura floridana]XP_061465563.1 olfactory receptor-like protein COR4 isoform X2 [Rhineura floridana]
MTYLVTLIGNLGMVALIHADAQLQTPMFSFLKSLSIVDSCYSTVITPKMLVDLLVRKGTITYIGCVTQYFAFIFFVTSECLLLAVMAYDRYVAICYPLLYVVIMSPKRCVQLLTGTYTWAFLTSLVHTSGLLRLSFCDSNVINHFFCDITPLLDLSSTNTYINELFIFTFGTLVELTSIVTILVSYVFIVITVLRIQSAEGRRKAFSTCTSHLMAVTIFHGTILFMYFRPRSSYSLHTDKVASVFYTVVIPMLNPLIYSLRNREVKDAMRRVVQRMLLLHC